MKASERKPGAKYFKYNIIEGERRCRIIVWDNARDECDVRAYANIPPQQVLVRAGEFSDEHVGVVYCNSKKSAVSIMDDIRTTMNKGRNNILVLCHTHKHYDLTVDSLNKVARQLDLWTSLTVV